MLGDEETRVGTSPQQLTGGDMVLVAGGGGGRDTPRLLPHTHPRSHYLSLVRVLPDSIMSKFVSPVLLLDLLSEYSVLVRVTVIPILIIISVSCSCVDVYWIRGCHIFPYYTGGPPFMLPSPVVYKTFILFWVQLFNSVP